MGTKPTANPWECISSILDECWRLAVLHGRKAECLEAFSIFLQDEGWLVFHSDTDLREAALGHTDLIDPEDL